MGPKKIIIPSDDEVEFYSKDTKKLRILSPNPLDPVEIKNIKKEIKNKGNFCSTTKIYYSWKDMVRSIINNTEYNND